MAGNPSGIQNAGSQEKATSTALSVGRSLRGRGSLWCVVCRAVSGGTQSSKGLRVPGRGVGSACGSGSLSGVSHLISKEFTTGTNRSLRSILSEFKRKKNLRAGKL